MTSNVSDKGMYRLIALGLLSLAGAILWPLPLWRSILAGVLIYVATVSLSLSVKEK